MYDMIFQKNRVNQLGRINLKKAGLAKIRVISLTPNISGELRWLLTPGILKVVQNQIPLRQIRKNKRSADRTKFEKVFAETSALSIKLTKPKPQHVITIKVLSAV